MCSGINFINIIPPSSPHLLHTLDYYCIQSQLDVWSLSGNYQCTFGQPLFLIFSFQYISVVPQKYQSLIIMTQTVFLLFNIGIYLISPRYIYGGVGIAVAFKVAVINLLALSNVCFSSVSVNGIEHHTDSFLVVVHIDITVQVCMALHYCHFLYQSHTHDCRFISCQIACSR